MNVKIVLLNRVIEGEAYRTNLKVLRYTRKRPVYEDRRRPCIDSSNLVQSLSCTTEAW
jgi:hypothetical protein